MERALEVGAEVWAAVRPTSSRAYLSDERIKLVELNLSNPDELAEVLLKYGPWDDVLHVAGATKCVDEADFFAINTEGTRNLAHALVDTHSLRGRFVYFSSLSVMGAVQQERDDTEWGHYPLITLNDEPRPNTAYGRSKLQAELALAAIEGLDYVVLRPTGVYGPREKDYLMMAKSIKSHIDFSVGFQPQDITFIYVRDLVEAALLATTEGPSRRTYFLTDGRTYDSRTFSDLLQQEMGVNGVLHICAPLWFLRMVCSLSAWWAKKRGKAATLNNDKYHIMAQRNWRCDIRAAQDLLSYDPQYPLERGVKETVCWYREHKWL